MKWIMCVYTLLKLSLSPRHKEGFGLTDGEVLERLWSFLRRFCRMTKEMRPSHRTDILTDALLHYCRLSARNLSKFYTHCMSEALIDTVVMLCMNRVSATNQKKELFK